jgi:beta-mannosidase
MEMHQRNSGANGRILQYLSQNYLYPANLSLLVYASQLLQADAIRYGVEHLRRNRTVNRCMGAIFWQLNDIWPVASWSSVDYYGRWKALHYSAKRFFAPVLLSCEETSLPSMGRTCISEPSKIRFSAKLCVSNETFDTVEDTVIWELRTPDGRIVREGRFETHTAPFSAEAFPEIDLSDIDPYRHHLSFRMEKHGSSGSVLFAAPKHYAFTDPHLQICADPSGRTVTITADAYARSVEIASEDGRLVPEDNYFDMEPGSRTLRILRGGSDALTVRSVYDIAMDASL